jgi:hypothetical protein
MSVCVCNRFDILTNVTGRCYALRLYIDLLLHKLIGFNATSMFVQRLLITRYTGIAIPYSASYPHHHHGFAICAMTDRPTDHLYVCVGHESLFPHHIEEVSSEFSICNGDKIPTARHVYGDASMDVKLLAPHFTALPSEHRGIYLSIIILPIIIIDPLVILFLSLTRWWWLWLWLWMWR